MRAQIFKGLYLDLEEVREIAYIENQHKDTQYKHIAITYKDQSCSKIDWQHPAFHDLQEFLGLVEPYDE